MQRKWMVGFVSIGIHRYWLYCWWIISMCDKIIAVCYFVVSFDVPQSSGGDHIVDTTAHQIFEVFCNLLRHPDVGGIGVNKKTRTAFSKCCMWSFLWLFESLEWCESILYTWINHILNVFSLISDLVSWLRWDITMESWTDQNFEINQFPRLVPWIIGLKRLPSEESQIKSSEPGR
jgi:hypothetical protein